MSKQTLQGNRGKSQNAPEAETEDHIISVGVRVHHGAQMDRDRQGDTYPDSCRCCCKIPVTSP